VPNYFYSLIIYNSYSYTSRTYLFAFRLNKIKMKLNLTNLKCISSSVRLTEQSYKFDVSHFKDVLAHIRCVVREHNASTINANDSTDANKAATSRGVDVRGSTASNTVANRPFPLSPELGESHGNKGSGFCHHGEYTTPVR